MTAYGSIQDAVTAMREGAQDFLAKPVDPDHLLLMVERAIAQRRMMAEYILLKEEMAERRGAPRIIGEDGKLRHVLQQLHRAAATDATVLLEGESGTGKELFARGLHALSPRADGPFVAINCAAIPDTLLETELFGHEKGAFTGAVARKAGRFELAHRGTLFLDEIGDLPLALQAKILRALEEKRFERVGGTQSLVVDVRVVAATNRNLKQRVSERQFREDLFFRLSGVPDSDSAPARALAGRRHPRAPLCRSLLPRSQQEAADALERGARRAQHLCLAGNVRELQNCIERAVILCDGDTDSAAASESVLPCACCRSARRVAVGRDRSVGDDDRRASPRDGRSRAAQARKRAQRGSRKQAAGGRGAAISYKTLLQKLKEYGIAEET
jgi:DNA-binding NtrC family response regulator